jgi:TolA-binding protein
MKIKVISIFILIVFLISSVLAQDDAKETELLFMAKKAYEDGFYEVSLGMLERFQKGYPDSSKIPQAILLSGQCYFYQGRYLEALKIFEALLNNPLAGPLLDAVYFWMGEIHFKGNNFEKSAALYQRLIDVFPQSSFVPPAYYSLGWSLAQLGKFKQAIQTFQTLITKFPQEPQSKEAAFKLIECLYNLKEYSALKDRIKPVFKLYHNDLVRLPYLYFYLAESEYYLDQLDEAAKDYLKAGQGFTDTSAQLLAKLGLGWSYLKLAKYKEAEDVFLEIKPENLDKKSLDVFLLGEGLLMSATNRIYEAKKLYDQLIGQSSDPLIILQAYLGKADAHYNLAEYSLAADVYKQGLDKIDREGLLGSLPLELVDKLRYNLAATYLKQGQVDLSLAVFDSISEKSKVQAADKIELLFQIAKDYEAAGELTKAEDLYAKIMKEYPDSSNIEYVQYRIALIQLKKTDFEKAVAYSESWLKRFPQSKLIPDALYQLATAYFQRADYIKSCEILGKFRDGFKDSQLRPQALYLLGVSFINLEKFNEAIEVFRLVSKLDALDAELLQKVEYETADCYYKSGQEASAVERFKILRSKYPNSKFTVNVMWWLGQYYYRNKDLNLAHRYFSALTKDYPDSRLAPEAFLALGQIFSDENKPDEAIDNLKKAINLGDADLKVQAAIVLAGVYSRLEKPQEELDEYTQIIKNNPDLSKSLFPQIAQVYYKAGNYDEAKKFYLKSLDLSGGELESAHLRFSLAEVLEASAQTEAAIKQYILAADLYTGNPQLFVRSLLRAAKLYEDKDNLQESLKIYKRIMEKVPDAPEAGFVQEKIDWIRENTKIKH